MVAVLIGINDNSKFFMPQIEPSRGFMKRINESLLCYHDNFGYILRIVLTESKKNNFRLKLLKYTTLQKFNLLQICTTQLSKPTQNWLKFSKLKPVLAYKSNFSSKSKSILNIQCETININEISRAQLKQHLDLDDYQVLRSREGY